MRTKLKKISPFYKTFVNEFALFSAKTIYFPTSLLSIYQKIIHIGYAA